MRRCRVVGSQAGKAEIGERVGIGGLELQRRLIGLDRLLRPLKVEQRVAEVVEDVRLRRVRLQRPPEERGRFLIVLPGARNDAEELERVRFLRDGRMP